MSEHDMSEHGAFADVHCTVLDGDCILEVNGRTTNIGTPEQAIALAAAIQWALKDMLGVEGVHIEGLTTMSDS